MKAIVLKKFGDPDSFELQDVAIPEVGIGELLVRVIATAINPLDYQIRPGRRAGGPAVRGCATDRSSGRLPPALGHQGE
jgi:NADPH:quinone reductase-like Zn-dependent oxidoreductase